MKLIETHVPLAHVKQLSQDGYVVDFPEEYKRVTCLTQIPKDQGKWGGLSLTNLMLDKHQKTGKYELSNLNKNASSGLYLIKMRNANKPIFKIGKAKSILPRLCNYKTSHPRDHSLLIVSCLMISNPKLVVAFEKVLIANLQNWCDTYPTQIKRLRRTEWFYRGNGLTESLVLRMFISLAAVSVKLDSNVHTSIHLFGKEAWNNMLDNVYTKVEYTPRWDVVNKKWKNLQPIEQELSKAEDALINDNDGFTRKELKSDISDFLQDVVVAIEPLIMD